MATKKKMAVPDPSPAGPALPTWEPQRECAELTNKISSRARHINLLLGAGASRPAGLPDVQKLTDLILADLTPKQRTLADAVLVGRNLEEALSRIRRVRALLGPGQTFEGFDSDAAEDLDQTFSRLIRKHLSQPTPTLEAHEHLAGWVMGDYYTRPIELFTVNYDLAVEQGLEKVGAPYFDGFVGNLQASFRADLVETTGLLEDAYPSSFARVWKLHGSLNWRVTDDGQVRRTGNVVDDDAMAAIYPSDEKYDQSRRVPFTVLNDRFRRALAVPESLTLISGYSFGDQHLNEIIFDAARRYPRSEVVVFCFGDIYPEIEKSVAPNFTVLSATEGIIDGQRRSWAPEDDIPESIWIGGKFRLGDFAALASFLSHTTRAEDWNPHASSPWGAST